MLATSMAPKVLMPLGFTCPSPPKNPHNHSRPRLARRHLVVTMERNQCLKNIATNFGIGATLGASIGAVYGTFDAFRFKIPGIYKIRHIGQTTVTTGAIFGTFLAAGALLRCGQ